MNNKANCYLKRDTETRSLFLFCKIFILNLHIHFWEPGVLEDFQCFSSFFQRMRIEQAIENAIPKRRPIINKLIFASPSYPLPSALSPYCFVR